MLIELKFKNLYSFKEENRFLMTRVKSFKEHLKTNVIETDKEFDLLKTSIIYGANGSGKTNFVRAIGAMRMIIFKSYSHSLEKDEKKLSQYFPFKLNSETEKSGSIFEVSFLVKSNIYRYGFEINNDEIVKEWLYRKNEREVNLFTRENGNFEINQESFVEGEKYKNEVNSNVLLISHLAQNNQPISKIIFNWFASTNPINALNDVYYKEYTANLLDKNTTFKKWVSKVLKYLEIANIEAGESKDEIVTYHNKFDKNNLIIDAVPFKPTYESSGTNKLIRILGPIYDTLRFGKVLFIDELDSKLHPNLTRKLVSFFHDYNKNGAQLIFTVHDPILLDKDLFRRDQIWFVEKDQFGASSLYSMSEFNSDTVRSSSAFDKKYLANEFGAADTLEINKALIDLIYE